MPILFSAIASRKNVVAKYASCEGNFSEIVEEVLKRISPSNAKMTYSHGHYLLHYINDYSNFYFCVTDKTCQRSRAFLFLNQIKRRFICKERNISDVLADEMYRYSMENSTFTIRKGELDELNDIAVGSSDTILGEKILFVKNSGHLRYRTLLELKEIPQTPLLCNEIDHSSLHSKGTTKSKLIYIMIFTVILIAAWLLISKAEKTSLAAIASVIVLCITIVKFSRCKTGS